MQEYTKHIARWFLSALKICKKKHLFISWNRAKKYAKVLKKVYKEC